jgi:signal peptidase I
MRKAYARLFHSSESCGRQPTRKHDRIAGLWKSRVYGTAKFTPTEWPVSRQLVEKCPRPGTNCGIDFGMVSTMSPGSAKRGLAAFLFSICVTGLGQIYNGQLLKGVSLFLAMGAFLTLSTVLGLVHSFKGFVFYLAVGFLGQIFIACEAVVIATRQVEMNRRPAHSWRSYFVGTLMASIAVIFVAGHTLPDKIPGVHGYKITADSMAPTLVSGDRVVSDMRYYTNRPPQRGDVVVFREPSAGALFIKRVVAVGGDFISLTGQKLQINAATISEPYVQYDAVESGVESGDFGPLTVPAGRFFVLGDNRNHSFDSRNFGLIGPERITARVLYIYWSRDTSRIGMDVR